MKILAIETATDICSIAFIEKGICSSIVEEKIPRQHAEKLPVFYNELEKKSGLKLSEIDAIAVSIGPGSFTGLRIGLSYSKGLAYSHSKPVIPVPTLQSLLFGSNISVEDTIVILSSHRNKYYLQQFRNLDGIAVGEKIESVEMNNYKDIEKLTSDTKILHYGSDILFENSEVNVMEVSPSAKWIGELAHQYYKEWIVNEPYKLVPEYISPFKLG